MNNAQVAELADALASGASDRKIVGVQVPPCAQRRKTRFLLKEAGFFVACGFLRPLEMPALPFVRWWRHGVPRDSINRIHILINIEYVY